MDHMDHFSFRQTIDFDMYFTIKILIFLKKLIFEFIGKMSLFCGGQFFGHTCFKCIYFVDVSFLDMPIWKSVYFLIFGDFSKMASPGQTTMLTKSASKFCVEPQSPFSNISHHDPKTM